MDLFQSKLQYVSVQHFATYVNVFTGEDSGAVMIILTNFRPDTMSGCNLVPEDGLSVKQFYFYDSSLGLQTTGRTSQLLF